MPTDSAYEQQQAALDARLKNETLQQDQSQQTIESSYGFDPKYSQDPYTKANLLARASAARFNRSTTSYASRTGGLYSGSLSRQRAGDEFSTGFERDTALKEYAAQLQNVQNQRLGSQTDYASGSASAYGDLIGRLTSTPAEPVEPPGGAGGGGGPGPGQTAAGGGATQQAVAKAKAILASPQGKSKAAIQWAHNILGR